MPLHYYFYSIDEELGLCYLRVPTWLPCRLQIYFNGHNWLASKLRRQGIAYQPMDNAFVETSDRKRAQQLANGLEMKQFHGKLDQFARSYCAIHRQFGVQYHWSVEQCEYATDVVFKRQADLAAIYETLTRTAIHTVKSDNIATFLAHKLSPQFEGDSGNRYNVFMQGSDERLYQGKAREYPALIAAATAEGLSKPKSEKNSSIIRWMFSIGPRHYRRRWQDNGLLSSVVMLS